MDIFNVISLFGGLALFLYGMNLMGEKLEKMAGGKLEKIFESLTSNPVKGLLLGTAVTAVIQSSSATTVMLVGFVNSGLMRLAQVIPIIMGANIGTTVTSWLLSLSGIEGDSMIMKLLKPTSFSPILAAIGILLIMAGKSNKKKDIGGILIGFAILMTGMNNMSKAVEPLADVPEFQALFTMFTNPVLGVLCGALLTAVIQSSSASVGILQALSATGQITFGAALPIILGQNIGTCVTALISSVGANKSAKRVGVVHLCFNVCGTLIFLIGFYVINAIVHFSFMESAVDEFKIAVIHTIFNLTTTLILFPFAKKLEQLALKIIKDDEDGKKEKIEILDDRLLNTPAVAIEQCRSITLRMADISKDTIEMAINMLDNYDEKTAVVIRENEDIVDKYEDKIGNYLVKLSGMNLTDDDSRSVTYLLHAIGDFERISDHAVNILETSEELKEKKVEFSDKAKSELKVLYRAVNDILALTTDAFKSGEINDAKQIEPVEEVVDMLRTELKNRHIERVQTGECTINQGFMFSDLLTNLERISDHCSNIALSIIQRKQTDIEYHSYINEVHRNDEEFRRMLAECEKKYMLS
ncbi:MAG: Na/Pi cotransporter family protein [Oscillospiraceae bacterium]|nr:Na/Pi cotransporter family protein [Oscillospiraceae bacterium]